MPCERKKLSPQQNCLVCYENQENCPHDHKWLVGHEKHCCSPEHDQVRLLGLGSVFPLALEPCLPVPPVLLFVEEPILGILGVEEPKRGILGSTKLSTPLEVF